MAGIRITVDLQDQDGSRRLGDLLERISDRRPLLKSVGQMLADAARARFRSESDIEGQPWTPLKASTKAARTRKGQLPLTILRSNSKGMSGSPLAGSIRYRTTAEQLEVGATKFTARIHQLGGTIRKPASTRRMVGRRFAKKADGGDGRDVAIKAHTITIPARPFLGVSRADGEAILDLAEDWLTRL